jgi:hypothetical protein
LREVGYPEEGIDRHARELVAELHERRRGERT